MEWLQPPLQASVPPPMSPQQYPYTPAVSHMATPYLFEGSYELTPYGMMNRGLPEEVILMNNGMTPHSMNGGDALKTTDFGCAMEGNPKAHVTLEWRQVELSIKTKVRAVVRCMHCTPLHPPHPPGGAGGGGGSVLYTKRSAWE